MVYNLVDRLWEIISPTMTTKIGNRNPISKEMIRSYNNKAISSNNSPLIPHTFVACRYVHPGGDDCKPIEYHEYDR